MIVVAPEAGQIGVDRADESEIGRAKIKGIERAIAGRTNDFVFIDLLRRNFKFFQIKGTKIQTVIIETGSSGQLVR